MASALMVLLLTGCAGSGNRPGLAPIPSDIRVCFNRLVPKPGEGVMKKSDVVQLIADLKRSEQAKSQCGKRLIAWYETQAKVFNQ